MNAPLDVILADLRARLQVLYGRRLDRLILFGSRARGDAQQDSDIDVMVLVEDMETILAHRDEASRIAAALSLQYDAVVSCAYSTPALHRAGGSPLHRAVQTEGVTV